MREPSRHIALLTDLVGGYGRDVIAGVSDYAKTHQPWTFHGDPVRVVAPVFDLRRWRGDGVIAQVASLKLLEQLRRLKVPVVNVSELFPVERMCLPSVLPDNVAVGRNAAEHLIERGLHHFAYLGYSGHGYAITRRKGFVDTLEAAGRVCRVFEIDITDHRVTPWEVQQRTLREITLNLPAHVGVMCCNDVLARQVALICSGAGRSIPDDLAVVGADNEQLICEMSNPPLSSVDVSVRRVGYEAAALLDRLMAGGPPPEGPVRLAPAGVVIRQSTEVLAIDDPDVAEAVRIIRRRAMHPIQVDDIVNPTATSRRSLERRFKRTLGRTIAEEITLVRIARAKNLLAHTDLPIADVAPQCGFNYAQQFNATFRRLTAMTPARYRRQYRVR